MKQKQCIDRNFKMFIRILFAVELLLFYTGRVLFVMSAKVVDMQVTSPPGSSRMGPATAAGPSSGSGPIPTQVEEANPDFTGPIQNVTAAVGRQAVLSCTVTELGEYKVGWMKAEDGTILTVHTMIVTHNPRVSVQHDNLRTWQLRLRPLKEADRGCYMCQINTSPMKKQLGCIDVHVPPDILDEQSSSDITLQESANAALSCRAAGRPTPRIVWRREDGDHIILRNESGDVSRVEVYNGESLPLMKLDRKQMGAYLCIASNDVPPAVSKRIMVHVNFPPSVSVGQQLVGVPTGADARLECLVQAFPPATRSWIKNREEMLSKGRNYAMSMETVSTYEIRMILIIKDFSKSDLGTYMCVASNTMGKADGNIRLYEIKVTTTTPSTTTTTQITTTTEAEYIAIPRFVVPLPPAEQKVIPDVTTYDTLENIIEQSVVDNLWHVTGAPRGAADDVRAGSTSHRPFFTFFIVLSIHLLGIYR